MLKVPLAPPMFATMLSHVIPSGSSGSNGSFGSSGSQPMHGGVLSRTTTVKLQFTEWLHPSVTVYATVVVPSG